MPLGFPLQFGHLMQPNAIHGASANNVTLPGLASSISSMPSSTGESAGSAAESRLWDIPADTLAASQARTVRDLECLNRAAREKEEQERLCAEQELAAREREQAERLRLAHEQQQLAQEQQRRARELELEKAAELQRLQEEKRKQDEERQRLAEERRKLEELRSSSL